MAGPTHLIYLLLLLSFLLLFLPLIVNVVDNDNDDDCLKWGMITSGGTHASDVILITIVVLIIFVDVVDNDNDDDCTKWARQRTVDTTHLIVFSIFVVEGHDDIFHDEDEDDDNDIFEWQLE